MEQSINNEVAATSNQAAMVFTPSTDPFSNYLSGEERAFRKSDSGLLFPFSKPELWEQFIGQGTLVKVSELKKDTLEASIMKFIPNKDWKGLRDFLNEALKPNLIEAAERDIAEAKLANPRAPKYSLETKRTFHHLHFKEGWAKSKIAEVLSVTYPTIRDGIKKIEKMNGNSIES